ncbi:hypothetical protein LR68_04340 [Anoxybacillus sp. BCO1]|nr:hypothetical protein LR68_04340 [Anoxybacillus sp. BCO1]
MAQENRRKQEHGEKNKKNLQSLIETYTREGHIAENISPYKTGYPNFDEKQFKLDHLITFRDGEVWEYILRQPFEQIVQNKFNGILTILRKLTNM